MARSDPQLNFRCPADLKERIEQAASDSGRSLTAEIVQRLEASFAEDSTHGRGVLNAPVDDILYIMLDANGLPVGWEELMLHLGEIVRSAGGTFNRVDAMMLNSKVPEGMDPAERLKAVRAQYRKKRFSAGAVAGRKPDPTD